MISITRQLLAGYRVLRRFLALCVAVLLLCAAARASVDAPLIKAEALRDSYSLVGQWLFQPGDDPAWSNPGFDDSRWTTMAVPQPWPKGGFPASNQIAWYRLALRLDVSNPRERQNLSSLGVRLGKIHSAYELYAGGQLLGGVGRLPPLSEVMYDRERVFQIPPAAIEEDGTLVLALRVWGGDESLVNNWLVGPYDGDFVLGEYRTLILSGMVGETLALLINTLFIGFGLYHLYLYRRNPQLVGFLWFGLMAVNFGVYGLMLSQWKYVTGWSFITLKKIEFGAIYLFPAIGIQAIWTLLNQTAGRWLRAYQFSFAAFALPVVLTPGLAVHFYTLGYWELWTLPALALVPWIIVRELRAGNGEARTLAVGVLIFIATCLNDLLIDLAPMQTARLAPYGFIAIMLAMAVSLANRFTTMLNLLEDTVEERTAELRSANSQLAEVARIDPLTTVLNRRGFAEEADGEIHRALRSGRGFTLVLADVDLFKQFNDRYGHACGDQVLIQAAQIIRDMLRDVDRVARWGGEEFIMLLPETEVEGAAVVAEKLRETIAKTHFEFRGQQLRITMTFGIAGYRKGETLDTCLGRADAALYQGKEQGRNKVMIGNYRGLTLVNP